MPLSIFSTLLILSKHQKRNKPDLQLHQLHILVARNEPLLGLLESHSVLSVQSNNVKLAGLSFLLIMAGGGTGHNMTLKVTTKVIVLFSVY